MLCWFESGHSDSLAYYASSSGNCHQAKLGRDWNYLNVQCLNFIPNITACPHFHGESRVENFIKMMESDYSIQTGLGIDDGVGIQVHGDKFRFRRIGEGGAYLLVRGANGGIEMKNLEFKEEYEPLENLRKR